MERRKDPRFSAAAYTDFQNHAYSQAEKIAKAFDDDAPKGVVVGAWKPGQRCIGVFYRNDTGDICEIGRDCTMVTIDVDPRASKTFGFRRMNSGSYFVRLDGTETPFGEYEGDNVMHQMVDMMNRDEQICADFWNFALPVIDSVEKAKELNRTGNLPPLEDIE